VSAKVLFQNKRNCKKGGVSANLLLFRKRFADFMGTARVDERGTAEFYCQTAKELLSTADRTSPVPNELTDIEVSEWFACNVCN
jgi:hypothetical protein